VKKPKLNRDWHHRHRMPENATVEQRLQWHLEHGKNCECRPMPATLMKELTKAGAASRSARRRGTSRVV
jgi:hypothetical protein